MNLLEFVVGIQVGIVVAAILFSLMSANGRDDED